MEFKHKIFNPLWGGLPLTCATMEKSGWMLYNVIHAYQHESVAVFVRFTGDNDE